MARQQNQRRPKGEGSITKLPNGKVKMTITIGTTPDGKQKRKSVTANNKNELLKKVSELRAELAIRPKDKAPYFRDVVSAYIKESETYKAPSTIKTYESVLSSVFKPLYDLAIDKITAELIDDCIDNATKRNGEKVPSHTAYNRKKVITSIFNWAIRKDIISKSPMPRTKKRPQSRGRADLIIPSEDEMKAIYESAKGILKPLSLLAMYSGCRLGELLGIRLEDIDTKDSTIDINKQRSREGDNQPLKTKTSERILYIQPDILQKVMELAPCSDGYLFGTISYTAVSMKLNKWLHQAPEVPQGFTFHGFRHYHATQLLKNRVDIKHLSTRLGHASITITLDLYAHWVPEVDRSASMAIDTKGFI